MGWHNKKSSAFHSLTLRAYDAQVAEALAMVRPLNKMTKGGCQKA